MVKPQSLIIAGITRITDPGLGKWAGRAGHPGQNYFVQKAKRCHSRLIFQANWFEKLGPNPLLCLEAPGQIFNTTLHSKFCN